MTARKVKKPAKPLPSYYAYLYALLLPIAQRAGYCLALHGSLARDLDLLAVPWRDDAVALDVLSERLRRGCRGTFSAGGWTKKPHGRRAIVIYLGGYRDSVAYIDLSAFPPRKVRT